MSLTQDPLNSLRFLEDTVSRLMSEPRTGRPWSPPVDIVETESDVVLKADLPDVKLSDIDVRVENQTLSIKGERRFERDSNGKDTTASSAATADSCGALRYQIPWTRSAFQRTIKMACSPFLYLRKKRPSPSK